MQIQAHQEVIDYIEKIDYQHWCAYNTAKNSLSRAVASKKVKQYQDKIIQTIEKHRNYHLECEKRITSKKMEINRLKALIYI